VEDTRYAYAVARIRALETRLLTPDRIQRIIDAGDAITVWREVKGWELGEQKEINPEDPQEVENFLLREMKHTRNLVFSLSLDKDLTNLFFLKYDIHNIKILLGRRSIDGFLDIGIVPVEQIKNAISKNDFRELPLVLRKVMEPEIEELRAHPETVDILLDNRMYRTIIQTIEERGVFPSRDFLKELFNLEIDIHNLKMLIRFRHLGRNKEFLSRAILYGGSLEQKSLLGMYEMDMAEVERYAELQTRECEYKLSRLWESTKFTAFGLEPLIAYLNRREKDWKFIRAVLLARIHKIALQEKDIDLIKNSIYS